ncbi:hypothetical protein Tco_0808975 [Tanacetum coccineum]
MKENVLDLGPVLLLSIITLDFILSNQPSRDCQGVLSSCGGGFEWGYTDADITDFETRLGKIHGREDADGVQRCSGTRFGEAVLDLDTARALHIAGRSQTPEKVIVTDLFYLRGMDVGSVNIPYLLARYLRLLALGRKRGAMISGGQFVARLAEHFGLLTEERLKGLTVILRDLLVIDMAKLPDAEAGASVDAMGAPDIDEGAQAVPAPTQAPNYHLLPD